MSEITVDRQNQKLIVQVEAIERLWLLNSRLEIPFAHVRGAAINPKVAEDTPYQHQDTSDVQYRGPVSAGTFYQHGDRVFWDVSDPAKAVVIQLKDDRYAELVVQVEDPTALVSEINQAIGA